MHISLISTILLFFSLISDTSASLSTYTITGELTEYAPEQIEGLNISAHKVTPSGQVTEQIYLNSDGEFQITGTTYLELSQIWLSVGDLYYGELLVSKDLHIKLNVDLLLKNSVNFYGDGIEFSGTDAEATSIANRWTLYGRQRQLSIASDIQNTTASKDSLSTKIDLLSELFKKLESIKNAFLESNSTTQGWIIEDKFMSEYYNNLFVLSLYNKTHWDTYTEALTHQPRILDNSSHLYYMYQGYFLQEIEIGKNTTELHESMIENLERIELPNRDFIILASIPRDVMSKEVYIDLFLPKLSNPWAIDYMNQELSQSQKKLTEIDEELSKTKPLSDNSTLGIPHKKFELGIQTYISEETDALKFIKSIQDKFQDKSIIVDIWATWCGPCLQDMKESQSVKSELSENNIEVVYVCTEQGGSIEGWEKRIVETNSKGTHILINQTLTTALMNQFEKSGFPSYLFFDYKGKYYSGVVSRLSNIDITELNKRLEENR